MTFQQAEIVMKLIHHNTACKSGSEGGLLSTFLWALSLHHLLALLEQMLLSLQELI